MLKIRTFIIALAFAPLISLTWQLTNQAGTNSPSKGGAGSQSGGKTPPVNYHPKSPSKGGAGSESGGANNGHHHHPKSPSKGRAGSESGGANNNSAKIHLSPLSQQKLNAAAANLVNNGRATKFSPTNSEQLKISLTLHGVSEEKAAALMVATSQMLKFSEASTTSNLPSIQPPQEQLLARIKASKANSNTTETNPAVTVAVTVDIENLNKAINIYNQIVLESEPATLQKLSRNTGFVAIGKDLTALRAAIN